MALVRSVKTVETIETLKDIQRRLTVLRGKLRSVTAQKDTELAETLLQLGLKLERQLESGDAAEGTALANYLERVLASLDGSAGTTTPPLAKTKAAAPTAKAKNKPGAKN